MNAKSDVKHELIAKDMEAYLARAEEEDKVERSRLFSGGASIGSETPAERGSRLITPQEIESFKKKSHTKFYQAGIVV